jgi:hypothetical protein
MFGGEVMKGGMERRLLDRRVDLSHSIWCGGVCMPASD